jgi:hypothetical protein
MIVTVHGEPHGQRHRGALLAGHGDAVQHVVPADDVGALLVAGSSVAASAVARVRRAVDRRTRCRNMAGPGAR